MRPSIGIGLVTGLLLSAGTLGGPPTPAVPASFGNGEALHAIQGLLGRSAPIARPVYKFSTVTLASGTKIPARWNPCQDAITYQVNLDGLTSSRRAAMLRQIRSGVNRLAAADGMTYRYTGTTNFVPQQATLVDAPADIVVALVAPSRTDLDRSEKSLGFGGVQWVAWSGSRGEGAVVTRGYVILTPAGISALPPGFGAGETQGNVILHELGHATGLQHVPSAGELMNPLLTSDAPAGYGLGDRAGLARAGADGGCVQIPNDVQIGDHS
jgi:hypothetical protein